MMSNSLSEKPQISLKWESAKLEFERTFLRDTEFEYIAVTLGHQGIEGYGEINPINGTRQTTHTLEAIEPELGNEPLAIQANLDEIKNMVKGKPYIRAGIETALYDLWSKTLGHPLADLLGFKGMDLPRSAASVSLRSVDEIAPCMEHLKNWPILKVELGWEDDVAFLKKIREVFSGELWADACGRWSREEAIAKVDQLEKMGVDIVIQPVPQEDVLGLRRIKENSSLKVFAGENMLGLADLPTIAYAADGVVVNPIFTGGLGEAIKNAQASRILGLEVLISSGRSGSVNIAACASIAGLADHLDLGAWLWLPDERKGFAGIKKGVIDLRNEEGLGVKKP